MDWILTYWVEALFSGMVGFGVIEYKKLLLKFKEHDAVKLGVQALLRDRIYQMYTHYMDKGFFPLYARENVSALFCQYKLLGGNGMIDDLMEKLMSLPTEYREV